MTSRRDGVRVNAATTADVSKIQMQRTAARDAAGPSDHGGRRGDSRRRQPERVSHADNHSEVAWWLRHLKRSVLKQDGSVVSIAEAASETGLGDSQPVAGGSMFGRAFDNAANMAASFFTATPFSGEVNFLTTSAFGHGAAGVQRLRAARRRLHVDRRAGGVGPLGRPRVDEPVGCLGVDRRRLVRVACRQPPRLRVRRARTARSSISTRSRARSCCRAPRRPATSRATSARSSAATAGS